jgi:hypothetical protein
MIDMDDKSNPYLIFLVLDGIFLVSGRDRDEKF